MWVRETNLRLNQVAKNGHEQCRAQFLSKVLERQTYLVLHSSLGNIEVVGNFRRRIIMELAHIEYGPAAGRQLFGRMLYGLYGIVFIELLLYFWAKL